MINFYVMDSNQTISDRSYSNEENNIFFEKINLKHLQLYKVVTICAYYNLLRFFRVIKKDVYISYIIVDKTIASYAVCYPKSFKYPFMGDDDYQIGSVYTDQKKKKKGYSVLIVENILQNINCPRTWYLTDSDNIPSINLCKKLNFSFLNNGLRSNNKFLSFLSIYKITKESCENQ